MNNENISDENKGEEIDVIINVAKEKKSYRFKINTDDTVYKLKELSFEKTKIEIESQALVYKGSALNDKKKISECNIKPNSTIILVKRNLNPPKKEEEKKTTSSIPNNTNNVNQPQNHGTNPNQFFNTISQEEISDFIDFMGGKEKFTNLGNLNSSEGGFNVQTFTKMLNHPIFNKVIDEIGTNPQIFQRFLNSPEIKKMSENNPGLKFVLDNPNIYPPYFSHEIKNDFKLLANSNNNSNNNSQGNNPFHGRTMEELIALLGLGNTSGNNDPRIKYKVQLEQLKEMGYTDEDNSIKLLKFCNGDLSKLFGMMEN